MYHDDVIIIESSPDEYGYRNNSNVRDHRRDRRSSGSSRPTQTARIYRVPAPRHPSGGGESVPVSPPQEGTPTTQPAPYQPGGYQPAHYQPGGYQPGGYQPPMAMPYPGPVGYPHYRAIPIEALAEGVTLAADGIAAFMPLPDPPPPLVDDGGPIDITNQNEHRHALAAHDKTTNRIRTGGRILGGVLRLMFGHPR